MTTQLATVTNDFQHAIERYRAARIANGAVFEAAVAPYKQADGSINDDEVGFGPAINYLTADAMATAVFNDALIGMITGLLGEVVDLRAKIATKSKNTGKKKN